MSEEQVNYQTGEILPAPRGEFSAGLGNVAKRIAAAMLKVGKVEKRGKNLHFKYDYATAEDVKRAARAALAGEGISVIPLMRGIEQQQNDKVTVTRVHFNFLVACEDGHLIVPWMADAQDTGDKGISKCATVALKYFLISLLQIPTGDEDDPDGDSAPADTKKRRETRKRKTQPTASKTGNDKAGRPMEPEFLRGALRKKAAKQGESGEMPATDKQAPFLARKFQECFAEKPNPKSDYHAALKWLWDVDSAKGLTIAQAKATLDWLLSKDGADDTGDTPLHEHAPEEARRVLRQAMVDAGQQEMELEKDVGHD